MYMRYCLFKSSGTNDAHFINCVWEGDPCFLTVREDYIFDYRLGNESDAIGKGNPEWNFSAPHGAGRIMSRTAAKANLDMEEYRREMAGIYTTSVSEATIDEAPMAYKSREDIIGVISDSVDVIEVLKPIYNFKAG